MPERDAEFTLSARDNTAHATESAADGFEHVGREADKAQRKIDEVGDQAGQTARKLLEAKVAALALAREFDRTGDSKILKNFSKINRDAAGLSKVFKSLKFDAPEVKNPGGFLGKIVKLGREAGLIGGEVAIDSFGEAFKALPGPVKGAMVGALTIGAAAAAPILAGVIEGAVVGGIGLGGIAGGLILGAQDPRVAEAYSSLSQRVMGQLTDAAKPFTGDILAAAPQLSNAFDAELPRIRRIFSELSSDVQPLLNAAIQSVHAIMPSIERAAHAAGPIIRQIAAQLPGVADAVGSLISAFSDGAPGAAAAIGIIIAQLRGMIQLLAWGARFSAPFLNFFGYLATVSHLVPDTAGQVSQLTTLVKDGGGAAAFTASSYKSLADDLGNTANMATPLQSNFDSLFNTQMSLDQANLAVNMGLQNVNKTIRDNKKTLFDSAQAGAENVQVILQQIQNLNAKREADIAAGNGTATATAQANAAYASQVEGLRKLLYSLGLNHQEVDRLISAYATLAQPQTKTFTTVYRTQGVPPGASDEKTGHARTGTNDYSAISGWAPAVFNAGQRTAFEATGQSSMPHMPPVQVHSESSVTVLLDGKPFRAQVRATTRAAEQRQAWRGHVGVRR